MSERETKSFKVKAITGTVLGFITVPSDVSKLMFGSQVLLDGAILSRVLYDPPKSTWDLISLGVGLSVNRGASRVVNILWRKWGL